MLKRVSEILPQLSVDDRLQIYLNNYSSAILDELPKDDRLEVILAGKYIYGHINEDRRNTYPDLKSFGKLYGMDKFKEDDYLLTIDDDICYASDYVAYMVDGCNRYKNRAIVTLHGTIYFNLKDGALSNIPARECRELVAYDKQRDGDIRVHGSGMGITCFCPYNIGIGPSILNTNWESGDDEEVSLYCQKNEIPIFRLAGKHGWITPDTTVHTIAPLYANDMHICLASEKLHKWTKWHYPDASKLNKPFKPTTINTPPSYPVEGVEEMVTHHTKLTIDQKDLLGRVISSEALCCIVIDKILSKKSLSVIRISDGEKHFIKHATEDVKLPAIILDPNWQKKYGVLGADHKEIGNNLITTIKDADFVGPSITGIYNEEFNTWDYLKDRKVLCDWSFPAQFRFLNRIRSICKAAQQVIIVHSDAKNIADRMSKKYKCIFIPVANNGHQDHNRIYEEIKKQKAHLVLMSGGPSGKSFMVKIAKELNKVVLDIGQALGDQFAI